MVNSKERIFLVIGDDFFGRQRAITAIKAKLCKTKEHAAVSILTFYGKDIDLIDLQEKVFTFSFSGNKILIFKNAARAPQAVKTFLINNIERVISNNYLLLEVEDDYTRLQKDKRLAADEFFNFLCKQASIYKIAASAQRQVTLDDFKWKIRNGDCAGALYIVEKLFFQEAFSKALGPQILGMLVRECSLLSVSGQTPHFYARQTHSWPLAAKGNDRLKKTGLFSLLGRADRELKKGGDPLLIVEMLLVKLFEM